MPSLPVAYQIATHFNVSIDWLCGIGIEPFSIKTYSDIFTLLVALSENSELKCEFNVDVNRFYSNSSPVPIASISFIDDDNIYNIFKDFSKMKNNLDDDTIDRDIFNYWIQKHKEKYQDKKITNPDDIPF